MDPAALGTLRIGLDAIAAENDPNRRTRQRRSFRRRRFSPRVAFAGLLRRAADQIEPRLLPEASH